MTLGDHYLSMSKETNATVNYGVSRVIVHPRHFATSGSPGDVAILVLDRPVQLSNSVKPVCLPIAREASYEGMVAVSAGWGVTEDGETSDVLRQVRCDGKHLMRMSSDCYL